MHLGKPLGFEAGGSGLLAFRSPTGRRKMFDVINAHGIARFLRECLRDTRCNKGTSVGVQVLGTADLVGCLKNDVSRVVADVDSKAPQYRAGTRPRGELNLPLTGGSGSLVPPTRLFHLELTPHATIPAPLPTPYQERGPSPRPRTRRRCRPTVSSGGSCSRRIALPRKVVVAKTNPFESATSNVMGSHPALGPASRSIRRRGAASEVR
jgi:hypothetical protein